MYVVVMGCGRVGSALSASLERLGHEVAVIDKTHPNSKGTDDLFAEAPHKAGYDRLYVIRDSKNPDGPKLYFTPAEWEAFRLGVIDGEFDDLAEEAEAAARSRGE